ncbi:nuclear transport factor 2 family protein [Marinibaculum pumilum]|uniref:Nuclear transport factor 2 family protein n=1 Tax=Marinibaculum pumilum TaxID=1766165 RepID=A0ABV7L6G2_9PROT
MAEVLSRYFDGLYHSDTGILKEVFHPLAHYVCATDGSLVHRTMDAYFPVVDDRPAPAARGEARVDEIVSIAFAGPVTAVARVRCAIGEKLFTDILTLVRLEGRWQIISKVFHYDLQPA